MESSEKISFLSAVVFWFFVVVGFDTKLSSDAIIEIRKETKTWYLCVFFCTQSESVDQQQKTKSNTKRKQHQFIISNSRSIGLTAQASKSQKIRSKMSCKEKHRVDKQTLLDQMFRRTRGLKSETKNEQRIFLLTGSQACCVRARARACWSSKQFRMAKLATEWYLLTLIRHDVRSHDGQLLPTAIMSADKKKKIQRKISDRPAFGAFSYHYLVVLVRCVVCVCVWENMFLATHAGDSSVPLACFEHTHNHHRTSP